MNVNRAICEHPGKMDPLGVMQEKVTSRFVAKTLSSMGVPSEYFIPFSTANSSSGALSGPFSLMRHS